MKKTKVRLAMGLLLFILATSCGRMVQVGQDHYIYMVRKKPVMEYRADSIFVFEP